MDTLFYAIQALYYINLLYYCIFQPLPVGDVHWEFEEIFSCEHIPIQTALIQTWVRARSARLHMCAPSHNYYQQCILIDEHACIAYRLQLTNIKDINVQIYTHNAVRVGNLCDFHQ